MNSTKPSDLFDAYYFAHGCGRPYDRDETWLAFFRSIAERIATDVAPTTVLDAGCAKAFLVETLRDHGIAAFGVDISEHAIAEVYEPIRPFCWVGSVADPFPQRYDLIITIEVLEHMAQPDAERAIANFCQHTDDVIFSSSPFDYKEVTHFNVHPPEYWAAQFARHNFFRDVDFDASFITPWATRFRRRNEPMARIAQEYERRFWTLWKENTDMRSLTLEMREEISGQAKHNANLTILLDDLRQREQETARSTARSMEQREREFQQRLNEYGSMLHQRNVELIERDRMLFEVSALASERGDMLTKLEPHIRELERLVQGLRIERDQAVRTMQTYTAQLEQSLARKDEHILYLEDLLKRIESGRVMQLLRRLSGAATAPSVVPAAPQPTPLTSNDPYHEWIAHYEPNEEALLKQRDQSRGFALRPLMSVITPVFNPAPDVLAAAIESVLAQTYDHWELCLVDGNSNREGVRQTLEQYAKRDPRIRVKLLDKNLNIAGNSNEALRMIQGDYVVLLDHDDLLAPSLLYEAVSLLQQHPKADVIYYDEDKVSADGTYRNSPWFKPTTWSPDLLLSTNYLMHCVVRSSFLSDLGGFDPEMNGAQDWDLALRCSEHTRQIYHIPRVLYHWRQIEGSASHDANAKPWAFAAQERCIQAHLARSNVHGAQISFPSLGRVHIAWPTSGAKVSIIIPTKDKLQLIRACIETLRKLTNYPNYEVILVDTGSRLAETHTYYRQLANDERIRIINLPGPFNYATANNVGVQHATGDTLLFLNNDTEILHGDWLNELVGWAERPEVGVVGCKLIRPDGTIQHAGIVMGVEGHGSHIFDGEREDHYGPFGSSEWYRNYMAVTGACMMMRRSVFEEMGGFDEHYRVGYNDIDLCLRTFEAGYRVIYTPFARVLHHEGGSRGFTLPPSDVVRASVRMWSIIEHGDPFFNPNLSPIHRRPTFIHPLDETREQRLTSILRSFSMLDGQGVETRLSGEKVKGIAASLPSEPGRRILLVSHDLSLSGAPLMLWLLATSLQAHGYAVLVVGPAEGPLADRYRRAGVQVVCHKAFFEDARVAHQMIEGFDRVIINTIIGWRIVYAAKSAGVPSVWWIHESGFGQRLAQQHAVIGGAFTVAQRVIFPAQATRSLYREFFLDNQTTMIHYGIDLPDSHGQPLSLRQQPDRVVVVVVGSIEPRKGQDIILEALTHMPQSLVEQTDIYFLGRVLDWEFYRSIAPLTTRFPQVRIVGQIPQETLMSYLAAADILVCTSRDEVLPVSIIEGMHHGLAILSTDVGGVAEVITHEARGLIVPPEDAAALAQALIRLIADPALRQRLGTAAHDHACRELTLARFLQEMEAALMGLTMDTAPNA